MRGIKCDLDTFFKFLESEELISESPLSRIFYARSPPPLKTRTLLSNTQIADLLLDIKLYSPGYLYPIIKFYVETGAKTSEVIELIWDNVDQESGNVIFPKGLKNQERKIKLSNELIELLRKKKSKKGKIFTTYYKESFTKSKITRAIIEFKTKTNHKLEWSTVDLRHSFAVNYLKTGGDIKKLQYILGHNNVYDTKRLYGEAINCTISDQEARNIIQ